MELKRVQGELAGVNRELALLGPGPSRLALVPLVVGALILAGCFFYAVVLPLVVGLFGGVLLGGPWLAWVGSAILSGLISTWPALALGGGLIGVGAVVRGVTANSWRARHHDLTERKAALEAEKASMLRGPNVSVGSPPPLFELSF